MPITLSYNASGIKVEEEASRVGLGWVLNAGGMISVTVMGRNHDFTEYSYFYDGVDNLLKDLTGATYLSSFIFTGPQNDPPISYALSGMSMDDLYSAIVTDNYGSGCDHGTEINPDVYNYNFGGYSGKFIFSHSGKIIKETEDNVLIIPVKIKDGIGYNILKSWKCITPDGTTYFFDVAEKNTFTDRPKAANYNSCYYLSKIQTVNGSIINFSYKKNKSALYRFNRANDNLYIGPSLVANYAYNEVVYLDCINYPGGKIRFQYNFDREDYAPEPKLDSIYIDDEQGNNKNRWGFDYSYFVASKKENENPTLEELNNQLEKLSYYNNSWNNNFYTESWNKKRLLLRKLTQTEGRDQLLYNFSYNETNLPTKLSTAIDHWGYHNGPMNDNLIPAFYQNISQEDGIIDVKRCGDNADREPNPEYNQAFILKEIVYPTGGKTKFSFESNIYDGDNFENDPYKKDYMYGEGGQTVKLIHGEGLNNAPVDWIQKEFLKCPPKMTSTWKAKMNLKVRIIVDESYNNRPGGELKYAMSIVSKNEEKKPWSFIYQAPYLPSKINNSNKIYEYSWSDIETDFDEYEIRTVGSLRTYIKEAEITVERVIAQPYYPPLQGEKVGGGIRIRQVDNYNTNEDYISGRIYKYVKENPTYSNLSSGKTSGKLMFYPRYNKSYKSVGTDGLRGAGYSVGYSTVHVIDVNKGANQIGGTIYEYINIPDLAINYSWYDKYVSSAVAMRVKDENPSGIAGYKYSENGTLLRETRMLFQDNKHNKQEEIEYKYQALGGGPYIVWGIRKADNASAFHLPGEPYITCINDFNLNTLKQNTDLQSYNQYAHSTSAWAYLYPAIRPIQYNLKEKIHKQYEDNGILETVTSYEYNSKNQVIKESLVSNTKHLKTIDYRYPSDILSNATLNMLTDANRINNPIEITQTINKQVSLLINDYKLYDNIPLLSRIKSNTGVGKTIEARLIYHNYDKYGNPLCISKDNATNIVYLWSYVGQYPIAEIQNANYSDVENAVKEIFKVANLNELSTKSFKVNEEPTLRANLDLLRKHALLKDALITTYTYKPLVGMLTATDPRGVTTYYEYDGFGRLKETYLKDTTGNKNTIQVYDYNYGNQ